MTMSRQCPTCLNFMGYSEQNVPQCLAFPEGIPSEIISGEFDHTKAHEGDGGIRYESEGLEI